VSIRRSRCLTFVLAAALVVQGLVAAIPHQHGPTVLVVGPVEGDGNAITAVVAVETPHRCLACSVHAPVVAPTPDFESLSGIGRSTPVSVHPQQSNRLLDCGVIPPRGPPRGC
jgi:hypothetical protein